MDRATDSTAPLQVTSQTTPRLLVTSKPGSLFLTVAKPAGTPDVTCTGIAVSLPIGDLPEDLVEDTTESTQQIDDYPKDSTGAEWTILREPPAPEPTQAWPSDPDHDIENIFIPDDEHYYQTRGRILENTSLTIDYGTTQQISTLDIVTGVLGTGYLRMPPFYLQASTDGSWFRDIGRSYYDDTFSIHEEFDTPLQVRYLRMLVPRDAPEPTTVVRQFLINKAAQTLGTPTVTFTCTPATGEAVFDDDRWFKLILANIPVNGAAGLAPLTVTASTTTAEDQPLPLDPIAKDSTDFVFENFSCQAPQVANGETTTLHWTGSPGSRYILTWDDGDDDHSAELHNVTQFETHELSHTTTFVLHAQRQVSGRTIHHYLSTTVTVKDPDIKAKTLTTSKELALANQEGDTFRSRSEDKQTWIRDAEFHGDVTVT
jgi:hypothetical protein